MSNQLDNLEKELEDFCTNAEKVLQKYKETMKANIQKCRDDIAKGKAEEDAREKEMQVAVYQSPDARGKEMQVDVCQQSVKVKPVFKAAVKNFFQTIANAGLSKQEKEDLLKFLPSEMKVMKSIQNALAYKP